MFPLTCEVVFEPYFISIIFFPDVQHLALGHKRDAGFLQNLLEKGFVQSMAGLGQTAQHAAALPFAMSMCRNRIALFTPVSVVVNHCQFQRFPGHRHTQFL